MLIYCKIISKIRPLNIINGIWEPPARRQCLYEILYDHIVINFRHSFTCTVIRVLPNYRNVPKFRCLIQGMSRNVTNVTKLV